MIVGMITASIIVGLAITYDAKGTLSLLIFVIGIRGVTWLVQKITSSINIDASQIIDFTGWSIAGVSIVNIIKNAMEGLYPIPEIVMGIYNNMGKIAGFFERMAYYADKMTFWN